MGVLCFLASFWLALVGGAIADNAERYSANLSSHVEDFTPFPGTEFNFLGTTLQPPNLALPSNGSMHGSLRAYKAAAPPCQLFQRKLWGQELVN